MADTLKSITLTPNEWTDLYLMAGIEKGVRISVQNIGASDVYLSSALVKPAVDSDNFLVIQPNNIPLANTEGDEGAWAFSSNDGAKINVSVATSGWLPTFDISESEAPPAEKEKLEDERAFRRALLDSNDLINESLCYLIAITEQAFDTKITREDVKESME